MQYVILSLQQTDEQVHIVAGLLDEGMDYAAAKAAADAAQSDVAQTEAQIREDIQRIEVLDEAVRAARTHLALAEKTLQTARAAAEPLAKIPLVFGLAEFAEILASETLTAQEKVQAMIGLKRAEIEAGLRTKATLLELQKTAQAQIVGVPIAADFAADATGE